MKATTFLFRRPLLIRFTLILVFLLAVILRFYWMSQKEMPYGDELTSVWPIIIPVGGHILTTLR